MLSLAYAVGSEICCKPPAMYLSLLTTVIIYFFNCDIVHFVFQGLDGFSSPGDRLMVTRNLCMLH